MMLAAFAAAVAAVSAVTAQEHKPLAVASTNVTSLPLIAVVPVPELSIPGRLGAACLDAAAGVLYLAATGNNSVVALNETNYAVVSIISAVGAVQGVLAVRNTYAGVAALFATSADGTLRCFSLSLPQHTLQYSINLGSNADGLVYDSFTDILWVGFDGGDDDGVAYIQASTGVWMGSLFLPSRPYGMQLSPVSNLIYASCPDAGSIVAVIDRRLAAVASIWRAQLEFTQPFAMAFDAVNARLFVTASSRSTGAHALVVLNAFDGSEVWSMPTASECDSVQYDADAGLLYVICGGDDSSNVYVLLQGDADTYVPLGIAAMPSDLALIRTAVWDAANALLIVAVPNNGPTQPASVLVFQRLLPTPQPVPTCAAAVPCAECPLGSSTSVAASILVTAILAAIATGAVCGAGTVYRATVWRHKQAATGAQSVDSCAADQVDAIAHDDHDGGDLAAHDATVLITATEGATAAASSEFMSSVESPSWMRPLEGNDSAYVEIHDAPAQGSSIQ